jgi:hypothetical protein
MNGSPVRNPSGARTCTRLWKLVESARAMSVDTLLIMPRAQGLFRRAIVQSGTRQRSIRPEQRNGLAVASQSFWASRIDDCGRLWAVGGRCRGANSRHVKTAPATASVKARGLSTTARIRVSPRPMGMGANPAGARRSVAPRMISRNSKVELADSPAAQIRGLDAGTPSFAKLSIQPAF